MNRRLAFLALVVAIASCMALRGRPDAPAESARRARLWEREGQGSGPSYAIYPTQRIPIRFDHSRHLAIAGVGCTPCHQRAADSSEARDRLVPPEAQCTPCHAIDRHDPTRAATPTARCDGCHTEFDPARPLVVARVDFPASNLVFSHASHVARGEHCDDCHGDMRHVALGTRLELPTMQSCFQCHREGGTARTDCNECHLTRADGTLRADFAEGAMNPPSWMTGLHHDADFWVTHRFVAADNGERCAVCHREDDCVECHDGRVRDRRNHPNDYVAIHAVEARQSAASCTSCHRTATFCETCHMRMGIAQDAPAGVANPGRFHPPPDEWSGRVITARHHAIEARRSLTGCVACHSERDCTSCHATTGLGGAGIDPHPPGFAQRCALLLRASPRACAQCHDDLATLAGRCR